MLHNYLGKFWKKKYRKLCDASETWIWDDVCLHAPLTNDYVIYKYSGH